MNAPLVADSFRVAVISTKKVENERQREVGTPVSGTVVSCQRVYSSFFHEPVWCVEALLDGGFQSYFGCKQKDLDAIDGAKKGQSFTALLGLGVGPSRDDMDVEPSTVWYIKDVRAGGVRVEPVVEPQKEAPSFVAEEMALRVA